MNRVGLFVAAAILAGVAGAGGFAWSVEQSRMREVSTQELAHLTFPSYAAQKVVYHVNSSGGWFDRGYMDLLRSLTNHVAAVGGKADLRVVLQGDGVMLLADAVDNRELRDAIEKLRAQGVRFILCRNSLAGRGLGAERLYGVKPDDIVQAAVAEISALEAQGFVYLRF